MIKYLVFFLLFILPLVVLPFGVSYFETPKIFLAEIVIEVLLVTLLFKKNIFLKKSFPRTFLVLILFLFVLNLSHLIFFKTQTAFFGNVFRLQGIFLLWHLLIFSLISSAIPLEKISVKFFFFCQILLFIFTFLFGVEESGRLVGSLGEPNALAATAVFMWPFVILKFNAEKKYRLIKVLSLIMTVIIIFLSGSRSGFLAFFLQLIFLLILKFKKDSWHKALFIVGLFMVLSLYLPFLQKARIFENRSEIWTTAFYAGLKSPILGNGFGNVEKLLPEVSGNLGNNIRFQYVDSSHNLLLDWWAQGGVAGLLIILLLIYYPIKKFILEKKKLELTLLIGLLTTMFFNPASITTLLAFWWIVGQGFSQNNKEEIIR